MHDRYDIKWWKKMIRNTRPVEWLGLIKFRLFLMFNYDDTLLELKKNCVANFMYLGMPYQWWLRMIRCEKKIIL